MRLKERQFRPEVLVESSETLEIIELYPDDKYLPNFLLPGRMYVLQPTEWDAEFRSRRQLS